tara:strand:- start:397 stop:531 length:135 start_codon:yes stop_codon:yes gene_type:complete
VKGLNIKLIDGLGLVIKKIPKINSINNKVTKVKIIFMEIFFSIS